MPSVPTTWIAALLLTAVLPALAHAQMVGQGTAAGHPTVALGLQEDNPRVEEAEDSSNQAPMVGSSGALITNQQVIVGLERELDLTDARAVLRFVLESLPAEVFVYPTENYFYFRFYAQGKAIWGTIGLLAQDRDQGVLSFGYSEHNEDPSRPDPLTRVGGGGTYSGQDGVRIVRIDAFTYRVTFEGRTVVFRLNDAPFVPPVKANLSVGEVFVGPIFDESGIRFHLMFDEAESHLFMILNDDEPVTELFQALDHELVIGQRTGFAFYGDDDHDRLILVGVRGENVIKNNWYDGPHDQMPDNYVSLGLIPAYQGYLEASYPHIRGRIDRYGNFLDAPNSRIAVAPYLVYFDEADLVERIRDCKGSTRTRSAFQACITEQTYVVPAEKRYLFPIGSP
jgi:hypothetical protein